MLRLLSALLISLFCSALYAQPCTDFHWLTDSDGSEKAAMAVTASLNGRDVELQFDTGSDASVLYGEASTPAAFQVTLGEIELGSQVFYRQRNDNNAVAGRLGLLALLGKLVRIDYPNQQICLISPHHYREHRPDQFLVPARIRANKLFLYARLGAHYQTGLFFDTGASLYALLVDKTRWQQLTGRTGTERDNRTLTGWSLRGRVTTIGAPLNEPFALGNFVPANPLAHFTRETPDRFSHYPIAADGLIGNAPFFDQVVILDLRDADHAWFGIVKTEANRRL